MKGRDELGLPHFVLSLKYAGTDSRYRTLASSPARSSRVYGSQRYQVRGRLTHQEAPEQDHPSMDLPHQRPSGRYFHDKVIQVCVLRFTHQEISQQNHLGGYSGYPSHPDRYSAPPKGHPGRIFLNLQSQTSVHWLLIKFLAPG